MVSDADATPAVSVVIPTFNRAHLVGRAVASVLAAMRPGDELIVVDDGSIDGTEAALASFGDRLRYVRTAHRGAGAARNRGVQESRWPLVAFLDSDDEWMPDKLDLQRRLMARWPDVRFCFSDFAVRDAASEHRRYLVNWHRDARPWAEILGPGTPFSALARLPSGRSDFTVHRGDLYPALLRACYVSTITVMVRRDAGPALRFAEDLPLYEDWECFARLARAGPVAFLDCETAWNHGHLDRRLTDADTLAQARARLTMIRRVWAADAAFLAAAGGEVRRTLRVEQRRRARGVLRRGLTAVERALSRS